MPPTINLTEEEEKALVVANFSPPGLPEQVVDRLFELVANFSPPGLPEQVVDRLFELYPDDPALGSPYNTGNETFGLANSFKRMASLSQLIFIPICTSRLPMLPGGDFSFQSQRRLLSQTAAKAGVKTYGYLFEQRLLSREPFLGGKLQAFLSEGSLLKTDSRSWQ